MKSIKAVFFDFDNTIVDYLKSDIIALESIVKLLPVNIDNNEFIDVAIEKIYEFHDMVSKEKVNPTEIHRYRLFNTLKHFNFEWHEQYLDIYQKNYIHSTSCFIGIEEVLKYLKSKVKLGILTNAYDSKEQRERIAKTNLSKYVDDIIVSCEIGTYKPSKEAFLYLVDRFELEASSCMYVGDSEEHDIKGAKNAGLGAIKISHGNVSRNESVADFECTNFFDLLEFFKDKKWI